MTSTRTRTVTLKLKHTHTHAHMKQRAEELHAEAQPRDEHSRRGAEASVRSFNGAGITFKKEMRGVPQKLKD